MLLKIEQDALNKVRKLRPTPQSGLRIEMLGGGCSGLMYDISWEEAPDPGDKVIIEGDVFIFIDAKTALFLNNFVLSYDESLTMGGFKLSSSATTSVCGCGKSFSL